MSAELSVFFFGDSICFGQGVSLHHGWVARMSERLSALGDELGTRVVVVNASVNGNTTRLALERMPYDVQSRDPDILLVQFGMNDCNYWQSDRGVPRVSQAAFSANLAEIAERARAFGVRRVLFNTNHPSGLTREPMPFTDLTYEDSNRRYNAIIRDVASSLDPEFVGLNDVEQAFDARIAGDRMRLEDLLLPDLLHPSERGHDLYFDIVYPAIERAVLAAARVRTPS